MAERENKSILENETKSEFLNKINKSQEEIKGAQAQVSQNSTVIENFNVEVGEDDFFTGYLKKKNKEKLNPY